MDEDVDGPTKTSSPLVNTGKRTATSPYNVSMVDTPRNPSKRQHRHVRGTNGDPSGNNATADYGGTTVDDANNPGEDFQASPQRHASPEGIPEDLDPDDLFEGANDNYLPKSKEDKSLHTEDYIVPEDPFEQERFRWCLAATVPSMKRKQQANEDALNDKWVEILSAEQDLEERHRSVPKSCPHMRLLPGFNEELTDDMPLTRGLAD